MQIRTNQQQKPFRVFKDLDDEEMSMLDACISTISRHVEKNIANSQDAGQLARMIMFRRLLESRKDDYQE